MKGPEGVHEIAAPNPSLCARASQGARRRGVESVNRRQLHHWSNIKNKEKMQKVKTLVQLMDHLCRRKVGAFHNNAF